MDLMTTEQAAKKIGVDRRTLARWVETGRATPTFTAPGYRGVMLWNKAVVAKLKKSRKSSL
jgi:excisionase family DNA binding protein